MSSLPTNVGFGSPASLQMRDAIASYRRSQYLTVGSAVASSSEDLSCVASEWDVEGGERVDEDVEGDATPQDGGRTPLAIVDEYEWDDILPEGSNPADASNVRSAMPIIRRDPVPPNAKTPLLRKAISFSEAEHPRYMLGSPGTSGPPSTPGHVESPAVSPALQPKPPIRRASTNSFRSVKTVKFNYGGKSTFGQTLFNSIAILLGIGMLSEPLAFSYAGWIGGTLLMIFYGFIACYTAKMLAHMILDDPRLRSYADIGRKAFGPKSTSLTTALFFLELFALSVILVTLYADSLHAIVPSYSANTYKLWGLIILIPTVFMPLSLLSYASILGILSTILIIVVVFIDGTTKKEAPGSLWQPAKTDLGVGNWGELGVAFGLFMAGFSGHSVIPSLARDMANPDEFDTMIDWAFVVATIVYTIMGYVGYLMFGRNVSEEVSQDLLTTPGYNPLLNKTALWLLVIAPLTKYALATRPVNITLEMMLGLETHPNFTAPDDPSQKAAPPAPATSSRLSRATLKKLLIAVERTVFTLLSVGVSILVPDFSSTMAFLGSFSAFILCIIYPVCSKVALERRCGAFDAFLLVVAIVMAAWGTVAAFWTA